jgi:hypothetical protein
MVLIVMVFFCGLAAGALVGRIWLERSVPVVVVVHEAGAMSKPLSWRERLSLEAQHGDNKDLQSSKG